MQDVVRDPIQDYHAHIYYDPPSQAEGGGIARIGRAALRRQMRMGSWHDVQVGPQSRRCIRSPSRRISFLRWCRS